MVRFIIVPFLLLILFSCKHSPKFDNLTEVSYSKEISPIISTNCTFSGCHGDTASQNFKLLNYDQLLKAGITSGSPESSKLYKVLKSLKDEQIMPKRPYNPLAEKQIQLIYVWIDQGAKNN